MEAIDCPACGKTGITGEACPRCGCDLSAVRNVLCAAAWHLGLAADSLRAGAWRGALHHATLSWRLRHSRNAARAAFLAAGAAGETLLAARWHKLAADLAGED